MNPVDARNRITQFYNLYVRYIEARQTDNLDEANRLRMEMADGSLAVQRDLEQVNQGMLVLQDAPALGGRQYGTRLVDVVLTHLADKYNIEPDMIQVMLRQAIGEYERMSVGPEAPLAGVTVGFLRGIGVVVMLPFRALAKVAHYVLRNPLRNLAIIAGLVGIPASLITIFQVVGTPF